jgi:hypothetical protein
MTGGKTMTEGPVIQDCAVVFLRARHLTADGRNHDSEIRHVASQRELCRAAAEQIDASVVKEYVEYGGTGLVATRPVVRQMLEDLRTLLAVAVRYILVASTDRLARKPSDVAAITGAIFAAGAYLVTAADLPGAYLCNPGESFLAHAPTNNEPPQTLGGSW